MFRCCSLETSHPRLLPQSLKDCSINLCLFFFYSAYRVIINIFLNCVKFFKSVSHVSVRSVEVRSLYSETQLLPGLTGVWSRSKCHQEMERVSVSVSSLAGRHCLHAPALVQHTVGS